MFTSLPQFLGGCIILCTYTFLADLTIHEVLATDTLNLLRHCTVDWCLSTLLATLQMLNHFLTVFGAVHYYNLPLIICQLFTVLMVVKLLFILILILMPVFVLLGMDVQFLVWRHILFEYTFVFVGG